MADYKAIKGHTIETVAGDPSVLQVGDIWYSNTTKKIRGAKLAAGAWASGGTLTTGRAEFAGIGTPTAGMAVAGRTPPDTYVTLSETYDGSSWTEGADVNTARKMLRGTGTTTAAMVAGGYDSPTGPGRLATEIWDG